MEYREIRDVAETSGEFEAWALLARRLGAESTVSWPYALGRGHAFCQLTPHLVRQMETAYRNELHNQALWLRLSPQARQHFHYGLVIREVVATTSLAGISYSPKTVDDALVLGPEAQLPIRELASAYFELAQQAHGLKNPVENLQGFFSAVFPTRIIAEFFPADSDTGDIEDVLGNLSDVAATVHPPCSALITSALVYFLLHQLIPNGGAQAARFLSSALLTAIFSPTTALQFSQAISSDRENHQARLVDASDERNHGDLTPVIVDFVGLVVAAQERIHEKLVRLTAQLDRIMPLAISQKPTERILFLVAQSVLCGNDWGITLEEATRFVARGPQQTRTYLTELEKQNLVFRPRKRPQRFALDSLGWTRLEDWGIGQTGTEKYD